MIKSGKLLVSRDKGLFLTNANPAACGIVSVFDRGSAWKLQYVPMNYMNPYLERKARPFGNPGVQNLRVPVNVLSSAGSGPASQSRSTWGLAVLGRVR